jgi:hypothetical protein
VRNVISVESKKVRRQTVGDEPSSDQKFLSITGTKVLACVGGGALDEVLKQSDQSEKNWL